MTSARTDDTVENGLLAMLRTKGLISQPEVTVTTGLAWLCKRASHANPLGRLIRDSPGALKQTEQATWKAEVRAEDGTRTDVECWWGSPAAPHLVIEAKLDAELTVGQVAGYLTHQRSRLPADEGGLFVVLVPAHRRPEAEQVLALAAARGDQLSRPGHLHTAVWDYGQVLEELTADLPSDPDLAQLAHFIKACEALDLEPFSASEALGISESRKADVITILDRATARVLPAGERLLPSGSDEHFVWRRYLEVAPGWTNIAVGVLRQVPRSEGMGETSRICLRIHKQSRDSKLAGERLRQQLQATTDPSGHTWLPLRLVPDVNGSAVVADLADQVAIAMEAMGGPDPDSRA